MSELGFGADEVSSIFDVVGALLHLTNADFDADATVTHSDSHAKLSSLAPVEAAARLLGIEQHRDLVGALTSVRVRDTVNAFTVTAARKNRDAFVAAVYAELFDWIVRALAQRLTRTLTLPLTPSSSTGSCARAYTPAVALPRPAALPFPTRSPTLA